MPGTDLTTYVVVKMRVYRPSVKVADKNPERLYTVGGTFYEAIVSEDGATVTRGEKLSIPSKNIDREDALAEGFHIDLANGLLTVPQGRKGRKAFSGLSMADIDSDLLALRNVEGEEEGESEVEPEVEGEPES